MEVGQEEMKSLGGFGIYIEARKIISSRRKIFSQINIALILPLSVIFLANIEVSNYLIAKIIDNQNNLVETQIRTPKYDKISCLLFPEFAVFLLLKAAYLLLTLIFSLLSISAVVYTVACIYTGQDVTFSKVLRVVPKVWKRLIITLLAISAAWVAYNVAAGLLLISWIALMGTSNTGFLILVFMIVYLVGVVYMSIVWQLANTVSVLEDSYGFEAMKRSRQLIKGKVGVTVFIFFVLVFFHIIAQAAFQTLVVHAEVQNIVIRVLYATVCLCFHAVVVLYGHVFHTIIYLVCKSYHNENIDKLALLGHLEAYSDYQEYVPLKVEEDVERGQVMV